MGEPEDFRPERRPCGGESPFVEAGYGNPGQTGLLRGPACQGSVQRLQGRLRERLRELRTDTEKIQCGEGFRT